MGAGHGLRGKLIRSKGGGIRLRAAPLPLARRKSPISDHQGASALQPVMNLAQQLCKHEHRKCDATLTLERAANRS